MLTQLLGKLFKPTPRQWSEQEVHNLIAEGLLDTAIAATEALYTATPDRKLRQICLKAEIAFRANRDEDADELYSQTLKQAPGFPDAHYGLSLLKHSRGDFEGAFQHALFAKNITPNDPRYLAQLGLCHIAIGNYPQAEDLLRHALQSAPRNKAAWNNLGIALLSKGQATEAQSCFLNALKIDPEFRAAHQNLEQLKSDSPEQDKFEYNEINENAALNYILNENSNNAKELYPNFDGPTCDWHIQWEEIRILAMRGMREDAINSAENLLLTYPDTAELSVLSDRLYRIFGDADSGLAVLQAFLVRNPDNAIAQQGMGEALLQKADPLNAEKHLKRARALGAENQNLLKSLGKSLFMQDRYSEALPLYEELHQRWPSDQGLAQLAIAHYQVCAYEKSLAYFEELQKKNKIESFRLQFAYAQTLAYAGNIEEAIPIMDQEIERMGNAPALRVNRAFMHLLQENFGPGWDGYRYRQLGLRAFRALPIPEWQGEDLSGKTIIVLAEQGLGDQIMFASCLPDLLALNPARVVVEVIDRVASTLARSFQNLEIIASRQDKKLQWVQTIENANCYVPLGELPRHFRRSPESFPRKAYLHPDPDRVRFWRNRLESIGPGPYFGASWRGGVEATRTFIRSLPVELLYPLTNAIPSDWISLQYGRVEEDLAAAAAAEVHLTHWPEAISDLDEFAALNAALDGVFTVCNTTVHYAGAVGQRTWVLAPAVPEWRYGLQNRHMPWYPQVEVLRQPSLNAWPEVIALAKKCLLDNYRPSQAGK